MRLRDMFKWFCPTCWTMFLLLAAIWLGMAALYVILLVAGLTNGVSILGFFIITGLAVMILWCGYAEAKSHYRRR